MNEILGKLATYAIIFGVIGLYLTGIFTAFANNSFLLAMLFIVVFPLGVLYGLYALLIL